MARHARHSAQAPDYAPSAYASAPASAYARENYGSGAVGPGAKRPKRRGRLGRRIALGVLGVVLVAAAGAVAWGLWFSSALNSLLAPDSKEAAEVKEMLVSVPLDKPFYMLLLGSDTREGSELEWEAAEWQDEGSARSDVMMLARIDAPNRQVTLVSIPRDTPYTDEDGTVRRVNEAYALGGPSESLKVVSKLLGVSISHYADIQIDKLEDLVDALGGVDVYVDRELHVRDALTGEITGIEQGYQTLNGWQAQVFVRARHEYVDVEEGQEAHRQSNVRAFAEAIVKKVLDRPVTELPGTVLTVAQYVTTDLTSADLSSLGMAFWGGDLVMYSCSGPTDGDIMDVYDGMWLCYPNPEGWAELMRQVDAGLEPGGIDFAATQVDPDLSQ